MDAFDLMAYPTVARIFTAALDPVFPIDLHEHAPLPEGATFKSLSLERVFVYYHHGPSTEHAFPRGMQGFGRVVLEQPLEELAATPKDDDGLYLVGGCCFDPHAFHTAGLAHSLFLRLRYDPTRHAIDGGVDLLHSPYEKSPTTSPVARFLLGFTLRYTPAA